MINLPHTLDLIDVVGSHGGIDVGYRFDRRADNIPPQNGEYLVGDDNLISARSLVVARVDANGVKLPDNLATEFGDGIVINAPTAVQVVGTFIGGETFNQFNRVYISKVPPSSSGNNILAYVIRLPLGSGRIWLPTIDDITVHFEQPLTTDSTLVGNFRERIKCYTTQLARSLDNQYSERYLITTSYQFPFQRRNTYLLPVMGMDSGFKQDVTGMKIERVETLGAISTITGQTFPDRVVETAISTEIIDYVDKDGNELEVVVPRVLRP